MRLVLVLVLVGCASGSSGSSGTETTAKPRERVAMSSGGGGVLRTTNEDLIARITVPAPPDRVWDAAVAAYGDAGVPVKTMDRKAGLLGNGEFIAVRQINGKPLTTFIDCGTDPARGQLANSYRITMSVLSTVLHDPSGGTRLETRVIAEGKQRNVSSNSIHCASTGKLEEQIAQLVKQRIGG
jgi:hypothetical protein